MDATRERTQDRRLWHGIAGASAALLGGGSLFYLAVAPTLECSGFMFGCDAAAPPPPAELLAVGVLLVALAPFAGAWLAGHARPLTAGASALAAFFLAFVLAAILGAATGLPLAALQLAFLAAAVVALPLRAPRAAAALAAVWLVALAFLAGSLGAAAALAVSVAPFAAVGLADELIALARIGRADPARSR